MLKLIKLIISKLTGRQKAVALLVTLLILGLAVYGLICSIKLWLLLLAVAACVASLYGLCLFLWKLQAGKKQDEHRKTAAEFIYWFLLRNFGTNTHDDSNAKIGRPFKPLHGESDVLMNTTASYNKFVTMVEVRLALASEKGDFDCDNFLAWLRDDSPVYDSMHNLSGCGGFPRYYATNVEIFDKKLLIRMVVMDSYASVRYVREQPKAEVTDISFEDDVFGSSSEDIPDDNEMI